MHTLTPDTIYQTMVSLFPAQNDFGQHDFKETYRELTHFGITTVSDFEAMMTRQRTRILDIDSGREKHTGYMFSPLHHLLRSEEKIKYYKKANEGNLRNDFDNCLKNCYWFSYVGLIRLGMELEFQVKYMTYLEDKWESQSGETTEGDWVSA